MYIKLAYPYDQRKDIMNKRTYMLASNLNNNMNYVKISCTNINVFRIDDRIRIRLCMLN